MASKRNKSLVLRSYPGRRGLRTPLTGAEKMRRATRGTPLVQKVAATFSGEERKKAEDIMKFVLSKTSGGKRIGLKKGAIGTSHKMLTGTIRHEPVVCFDRCNLAIGLLNAAGIKSWLAREISLGSNAKWEIHDYVEASIGGQVHTLAFGYDPIEERLYHLVIPKPAHEAIESTFGAGMFLRGADSANIGGVKSMKEVTSFRNRLEDSLKFKLEREKNKRRVDLLVKEGIMPNDFALSLKKAKQA